jgi:multiple RNA-binding domain-containing protein 1
VSQALAFKKFHHVPLYLEWAPANVWDAPLPPRPLASAGPGGNAEPTPQTAESSGSRAGLMGSAPGAGMPSHLAGPMDVRVAASASMDDADNATGSASTIYIKNLAFATTDASLRKHFDRVVSAAGGVLHSVRVAKRPAPPPKKGKDTGSSQPLLLSAGYGFVEVDSAEVAAAVIQKLQV